MTSEPQSSLPARAHRVLESLPFPLILAGVAAFLLAHFAALAQLRLIDGDEGFYLYAGRLTLEGRVPYRDFFYPQMPLMPYLYAAIYAVTGPGWVSGRMLSSVAAALLGILLFCQMTRRGGPGRVWALIGIGLYAASSMSLGYYPVAKTQALSALLAFASWQLLANASGPHLIRAAASGFLLGVAVDARLMMAGFFPALLWGAFRPADSARGSVRSAAAFCAGCAAALAFNLPLLLADPGNYVFGNLTYHANRSHLHGMAAMAQRVQTALEMIGLSGNGNGSLGVQNSFLFLMAAMSVVWRIASGRGLALIHGMLALGILTAFLPSPCFVQYFTILLPFIVLCAVEMTAALASLASGEGLRPLRVTLGMGLAVVLIVYAGAGLIEARRLCVTGMFLPAVNAPTNAFNWKISTMHEISRRIDLRIPQGASLVTWWPGYCLESNTTVIERLENHFGTAAAGDLPEYERKRRRVMFTDDIETMIRERKARMVLLGNWTGDWISNERPRFVKVLHESGYGEIDRIGSAVFYVPLE